MREFVELVDLVEDGEISYGIVQPGAHVDGGTPIARVKDIRDGVIDQSAPLCVSPDVAGRFTRTTLRGGELLITLVGTTGETAVVPPTMKGWNVARAVAVVRPVGVTIEWLRYAFSTPQVRSQIDELLNTTVQATLNLSDLKRIRIPMPAAREREAIAEVLGALDDKIAANRILVTKSMELSHTLVTGSQWLVQATPLSNISEALVRGIAPKYTEVGSPVINQKCIRNGLVDKSAARRTTPLGANNIKLLRKNDVLVNSTGQGTLGRVARWTWDDSDVTADSHVSIVRFDTNATNPVFAGTVLARMQREIEDLAEGSTGQTELRRDLLGSLKLDLPRREVQERIGGDLTALAASINSRQFENQTLAKTRDELLPLLMDGRITVKQAEQTVEDVL